MMMKHCAKVLMGLTLGFSATLFAQEETVIPSIVEKPTLPAPESAQPSEDFVPAPTQVEVQSAPIVSSPVVNGSVGVPAPVYVPCSPRTAQVFAVSSLEQCGRALPNSGVRGVINRNLRRCTEEVLVANVFANPNTCEDCSTKAAVKELRCLRNECMVCSNPVYLSALIQDLASYSRAVRVAATTSLRLCKLHVTHKVNSCVAAGTPPVIFYQDLNAVAQNLSTL